MQEGGNKKICWIHAASNRSDVNTFQLTAPPPYLARTSACSDIQHLTFHCPHHPALTNTLPVDIRTALAIVTTSPRSQPHPKLCILIADPISSLSMMADRLASVSAMRGQCMVPNARSLNGGRPPRRAPILAKQGQVREGAMLDGSNPRDRRAHQDQLRRRAAPFDSCPPPAAAAGPTGLPPCSAGSTAKI
jgi:hypothetical protein